MNLEQALESIAFALRNKFPEINSETIQLRVNREGRFSIIYRDDLTGVPCRQPFSGNARELALLLESNTVLDREDL